MEKEHAGAYRLIFQQNKSLREEIWPGEERSLNYSSTHLHWKNVKTSQYSPDTYDIHPAKIAKINLNGEYLYFVAKEES